MERFNSKEDKPETFRSIATDLVSSDFNRQQLIDMIVEHMSMAYIKGQRELRQIIKDDMPDLNGNQAEYLFTLAGSIPVYLQ